MLNITHQWSVSKNPQLLTFHHDFSWTIDYEFRNFDLLIDDDDDTIFINSCLVFNSANLVRHPLN